MSVSPELPGARALLDLLQLERRAREAATPEALGFVMVNETLRLAPYRQAALWSASAVGAGAARILAVSGLPQPEPTAPYVQWLADLCRHLAASHRHAHVVSIADLPERIAAGWQEWLPLHALWLPLKREEAPEEGALLLARSEEWQTHEIALLEELAQAYAHAWAALRPRQSFVARTLAALRQGRLRLRLATGIAVALLVPVKITVLGQAEVMPRDAFVVRAPIEGVVEHFDVQPNQPVRAGDALFSLDPTVLRTRMDLASKALDTAQEEYRQSAQRAVSSDKSRAEVGLRLGKLQEKAVEMEFTAEQLARVQARADRDGVAVFADGNDWIGKTVGLGERVLLIADPAKVELVVWLPVADLLPVAPGDTLSFHPQGAPLASFTATASSIAYRAEAARDGVLAYRIKASFPAGEPAPRLGQLGSARLHGGWAPLAYVVLRRPLAALRQWLW